VLTVTLTLYGDSTNFSISNFLPIVEQILSSLQTTFAINIENSVKKKDNNDNSSTSFFSFDYIITYSASYSIPKHNIRITVIYN